MPRDPKQIVTPFAFEVHPDLLGLPLASPRRRLAALLIDLLLASFFSLLGPMILAGASTAIFFWIAIRTRNKVWWQNILRFSGAALASLFIFTISFSLLKDLNGDKDESQTPDLSSKTVVAGGGSMDWTAFSEQMTSTDFTDEESVKKLEAFAEDFSRSTRSEPADQEVAYDSVLLSRVQLFTLSAVNHDSSTADSLRPLIAAQIASPELMAADIRNDDLDDRIDAMEDELDEWKEKAENPGFFRSLRATAEEFGLTVGWVGIYFVLSLALLKGRTPGKWLLKLQVLRLNNKPIGIWYSFERFGGYAAGIATGLLGFFQIYWDANRQAIHDKIAGTVVVDLRESKKRKTAHLKEEILEEENLIHE